MLDVSGKVEAIRGGQRRALVAGDAISGDDVIETGPDGRVTLRLRHNGATIALPPGRSQLISASPAWALAPIGGAAGSAEISAAAGRHTGEEEADTNVSAARMTMGAGGTGGSATPGSNPTPVTTPTATDPLPPAPPPIPPVERDLPVRDKDDGRGVGLTPGSMSGRPGEGTPADMGGGGAGADTGKGVRTIGTPDSPTSTESPSPQPPPPPDDDDHEAPKTQPAPVTIDITNPGTLDAASVKQVLAGHRAALAACGVSATTTVTLAVNTAGKVTTASFNGSAADVVACMSRDLKATTFASGKAATSITAVIRP